MHSPPPRVRVIPIVHNSGDAPPRSVEYAYYAVLIYGVLAVALGLQVSLLAGGMVVALTAYCLLRLGSRAVPVYTPIALPLGYAVSFLAIQVVVHDESLQGLRPFVIWLLMLILVYSLSLRQGFLHRFVRVAFVLGLAVLPYLEYQSEGVGVERAGLDRTMSLGELANPNGLAAWFGFCAIYFIIVGIETKRNIVRVASWLVTVMCLFIVSLTVSRGAPFAFAVAAIVAVRRLLKRGFIPLLALVILGWITYEVGIFKTTAGMYATRGAEETGRFIIWPLVIERFLSSPLTGVGISHIGIYTPAGHMITPHNSFLYIALSSGVAPLVFFLACWIRAVRKALGTNAAQAADAPFRVPLLLYAFVVSFLANDPFMSSWMIVTLSVVMTAGSARQVYRKKRQETAEHGRHKRGARYAMYYQRRNHSMRV
jgi:O-antigen ligase